MLCVQNAKMDGLRCVVCCSPWSCGTWCQEAWARGSVICCQVCSFANKKKAHCQEVTFVARCPWRDLEVLEHVPVFSFQGKLVAWGARPVAPVHDTHQVIANSTAATQYVHLMPDISNNLSSKLSVHLARIGKPLDFGTGIIRWPIDPLEAKGPTHMSGLIEEHWVITELSKVKYCYNECDINKQIRKKGTSQLTDQWLCEVCQEFPGPNCQCMVVGWRWCNWAPLLASLMHGHNGRGTGEMWNLGSVRVRLPWVVSHTNSKGST